MGTGQTLLWSIRSVDFFRCKFLEGSAFFRSVENIQLSIQYHFVIGTLCAVRFCHRDDAGVNIHFITDFICQVGVEGTDVLFLYALLLGRRFFLNVVDDRLRSLYVCRLLRCFGGRIIRCEFFRMRCFCIFCIFVGCIFVGFFLICCLVRCFRIGRFRSLRLF